MAAVASAGAGTLQVEQYGGATGVLATSAWATAWLSGTNGTNAGLTLYYATFNYTTNTGSWAHSNYYGMVGTGIYYLQMTQLTAATKYYYRWKATETTAYDWTSTSNFTTLATAPTGTVPGIRYAVMVHNSGVLAAPSNFFLSNSVALLAALTNAGVPTNESGLINWLATNTYVQSNTGDWAGTWKGTDTNYFANTVDVDVVRQAMTTGKVDKSTFITVTNDLQTQITANTTGKVSQSDSTYTATVSLAASSVQPGDTNIGVRGITNLIFTDDWTTGVWDNANRKITVAEPGRYVTGTVIRAEADPNWAGFSNSYKALTNSFNVQTNRFNVLSNEFSALSTDFDVLTNSFNIQTNRFNILSNAFNTLSTDFNTLTNNFNGLTNDFNVLTNRFNILSNEVAGLGDSSTNWSLRAATGDVNYAGYSATNMEGLFVNRITLTNDNESAVLLDGAWLRLENEPDGLDESCALSLWREIASETNVFINGGYSSRTLSYFRHGLDVGGDGFYYNSGYKFRVQGLSLFDNATFTNDATFGSIVIKTNLVNYGGVSSSNAADFVFSNKIGMCVGTLNGTNGMFWRNPVNGTNYWILFP